MTKKLYDYVVGEDMNLPVLIKAADVRLTKMDKEYIAFTFQDKSGQMDAKFWGASKEDIEAFQVGKVVLLIGQRDVYKNTPQIKITSLKLVENARVEHFMERAPMDVLEIEEEMNVALCWIEDAIMARIVRCIYQKYKQVFYEYPAAKRHHHALVGGLSYHTLSMLRLAKSVSEQYPEINLSLLAAGVVLHDIGKVVELSGSVGTDYTLEGNLIGHIVIMSDEITKACIELNIDDKKESVLLLKHIVLSHHGKLEYGSPVVPKILEAEVLHHLDMLDATLNMMTNALEKTEAGQYSDKIYGLDNRMFYKPK
ncbi:HD domain-containing protein [Carnobacteriaceae bacterium zg-ZUI78]|nr:HD domain-containing protein [Carnobacteriaceae bacterium zg-ZUI78]